MKWAIAFLAISASSLMLMPADSIDDKAQQIQNALVQIAVERDVYRDIAEDAGFKCTFKKASKGWNVTITKGTVTKQVHVGDR